jgi:hypothetical protein
MNWMWSTLFGTVKFPTLSLQALEIIFIPNFEISTLQCSTHCTPDGRGDVLDIVVHQNVRLSEVIVTDILHSGHLPIMFWVLLERGKLKSSWKT